MPKSKSDKTENICFVLMPYGGLFDSYFEEVYKPAIVAAGLDPFRADDLYRPSQIIKDVWEYTKRAKILLAELTGKNPNVFYELGLAHALSKPVVLVTESIEDVPFDLRGLRVIEYNKNLPNWGELLRNNVTQALTEVQKKPNASIPSYFLEVKDKEEGKKLTKAEKEILDLRQEVELLRREVRPSKRKLLSSSALRNRVQRYLEMGMSEEAILRRLTNQGVSEEWLLNEIPGIKRAMKSGFII